jgi:hypothetical protein
LDRDLLGLRDHGSLERSSSLGEVGDHTRSRMSISGHEADLLQEGHSSGGLVGDHLPVGVLESLEFLPTAVI